MKDVWTKKITTVIKEYEYDDKGNVIKTKETTIETVGYDGMQEIPTA